MVVEDNTISIHLALLGCVQPTDEQVNAVVAATMGEWVKPDDYELSDYLHSYEAAGALLKRFQLDICWLVNGTARAEFHTGDIGLDEETMGFGVDWPEAVARAIFAKAAVEYKLYENLR